MSDAGNLAFIVVIIIRIIHDSEAVYPEGACYEIWEPNEEVVCRGPRRRDKIACIEFLGDKQNYGLLTPTNETIIFDTPNFERQSGLKVYKGSNVTTVPYERSEVGLALVTPDKYKIWIKRIGCIELIYKHFLERDERLVANFTFDYEEKNCYKIYEKNEVISPYTCDDPDIFETCFEEIDNCLVITTQNDENVTLGCSNETYIQNCINVSHEETTSEICIEKLEERCVGFITPSGLRILVTCTECFRGNISYFHDRRLGKKYHQFVKTYIRYEYQAKHSYTNQKLGILKNKHTDESSVTLYACFANEYNWYVLPLDNNEIVFLPDSLNKSSKHPGCYTVVDSDTKAESLSCAQIINERCIGLITPKNRIVALQCYHDWLLSREIERYLYEQLEGYRTGRYVFPKDYIDMFQRRYKSHHCESIHIRTLERSVITTPAHEKIILDNNDGSSRNGCYSVSFGSEDIDTNVTLCVQVVTDVCVGLITPGGWRIIFSCYPKPDVYQDDGLIPVDIRFTFQVKGWEPIFKYK